ncbi:hypothetical protein DP113_21920 [Brasilonema octagenarum UFV-E1]|uniref:DUF4347 domain-containing protein n=1 Tax=Brasilonema sennae CENA114 TaxID=415709 RepID=A0A856MJ57_9CYAN|nr:DUF4347 domain-containing protein [Brasilonema sennae]QDL10210.1 hypothetical protein DP114_22000 [Brasilonema sennae CENA114]QDL16562.1 hypothetical protein DP113_21920 [Brasilonema octagenarum UFV-E1]
MKITGILFIDPSVNNYEILLEFVVANIKAIVLDPEQDGVVQITQVLSQHRGVENVHIVSHGSPGTLTLGNSELSLNTLELYADQLKNWFSPLRVRQSLTPAETLREQVGEPERPSGISCGDATRTQSPRSGEPSFALSHQIPTEGDPPAVLAHATCLNAGNPRTAVAPQRAGSLDSHLRFSPVSSLLLYGCHVAAGDAGEEFITKLHQLTKANVAASANLTGNAILGGDWNLEVNIGNISNQPLALSAEVTEAYPYVLNSAPILNNTEVILSAVNQNAGAPIGAVGTPIFSLVTLGGNVIDQDPDALTGIAITNTDTTNGNWFYTINNGTNWAALGSVSDNNARLLAADAITRVYFQPNPAFSSPSPIANALAFHAWDQTTGTNGSTADTTLNGEATAFSTGINTAAITVNAVNSAPTLNNTNLTLTAIDEDAGEPTGPVGTLISSLVTADNVIDPDSNALRGVAITNADNTNGNFFYSADDGNSWAPLELVSNTNARLLAADGITRIYFQPKANFNGTINNALTFRAWDQTTGTNTSIANTTISGGTTAFSSTTGAGGITINSVNDAPTLSEANITLTAINQNVGAPIGAVGTLVSSLVRLGDNVIDPDSNALTGIAITNANNTNGNWFYSTNNGSSWIPVGILSDTNARLLAANASTRIYFQPNGNFNGSIENVLTFRAWDQTTGTNGSTADTTLNGIATAFSTGVNTSTITINAVNNAPILLDTNLFLSTVEDAAAPTGPVGTLVSSLVSLGVNVTDSDNNITAGNGSTGNALTGLAITNANTTNGSWFYSTDDGSSWAALGAVSDTNARLLTADGTTRLYFQPTANFNGSINNALTFRAWDQTTGTNGSTANTTLNGGATAFSIATDTVAITVDAVNDAPILRDTNVTLTAIDKNAGAPIGAVGTLVSSLVSLGANGNVTDPDTNPLTGVAIANADTTNGTFFYSTDNGNNWAALGVVSNTNARLLAADANTRIYFQPNANFNGTISNALTFRAWDQTTGTNGSTADTTVNGGATAFSSATDTAAISIGSVISPINPATPPPNFYNGKVASTLKQTSNNIFQLEGSNPQLEVTLNKANSNQVNELGVFVVDDDQGTINGIAPGAENYAQAALSRAKTIFSAITDNPNGFNTDLTRLLAFNSSARLQFFLVNNSSIDAVQAGSTSAKDLIFSNPLTQKVTDLGNGEFTLALNDTSNSNNSNFQNLVVNIKATNQSLPLGASLQGNPFGELIDLRNVSTQVKADFVLNREARNNDFVGFYQVADANGGIDLDGNGTVDLRPGDAGYAQAAVQRRVPGIDLTVANQSTATFTHNLSPGSLLAPFIISNGTPDAILDGNPNNDPAVYFSFLGANSDKADHIRLLGNNTFGFEDLASGGDKDYNDMIVKVNLSNA